ncbi:MAG: hypothetical protein AAF352_00425, partial [Pseudomonadota bacterium]
EKIFMTRLQNIMADRTLVLITHRYSLLDLVDRLIVLDNGSVVADGPKAQVITAMKQGTIRSVDI